MAGEEGGGSDEQRAWEDRMRRESRAEFVDYEERIVPPEIIDDFRELLVRRVRIPGGGVSEDEGAKIIVPRARGGEALKKLAQETVVTPKKKETPKEIEVDVPFEGLLTPSEETELYRDERKLVEFFLDEEDYMGKAAVKIVAYNRSVYPYETRATLEPTLVGMKGFKKRLDKEVTRIIVGTGGESSERLERVKADADKIREWFDGNRALLVTAPSTLLYFWDGLAMMQQAVRETREAVPIITPELHKMFTAPGEKEKIPMFGEDGKPVFGPDGKPKYKEVEWRLGKEIVEKQDQAFEILRGIAAAHRHPGRNMGQLITPQSRYKEKIQMGEKDGKPIYKQEIGPDGKPRDMGVPLYDYPVTSKQIDFIEKYFGYDPKNDSASEEKRTIETLRITSRDELPKQLNDFFANPDNRDFRIALGQEYFLTKETVEGLKKDAGRLSKQGSKIWFHGVPWEANPKTFTELGKRAGVGDVIFVGVERPIERGEVGKIDRIVGENRVGILKKTPKAILNPFVMRRTPERIEDVNRRLAAMLNVGRKDGKAIKPGLPSFWERLAEVKGDADFKALCGEFEQEMKNLEGEKIDVLDKYILDMTRITLLYFLEGANLGWGFEYEEDKENLGEGVYKRVVATGATDACTDIGTFFDWLMTEGSNRWKWWSHSTLPLDKNAIISIREHEPGWAPMRDKEGKWTISYLGQPLTINAPTKFDVTYLDSSAVIHGEAAEDKAMKLVLGGTKMSELSWLRFLERAPYRWKVTLGQAWYAALMFSGLPNRDLQEKFFGGPQETPRTIELEELSKRLTLGMRDMGKKEDVEAFLPLSCALFHAWSQNLLPSSPEPGDFDPYAVGRLARRNAIAIRNFAPEGDTQAGERAAKSFLSYGDQLMKIGLAVGHEAARKEIRSWFGR